MAHSVQVRSYASSTPGKPCELVIGDPHDQPGLVPHIPEGVAPTQIVNFYHFAGWPKAKAYCAKCSAHRHRDGYTVELSEGSWILAGGDCCEALWGDDWRVIRKQYQVKLHEAGIILDARTVLSELRDIRAGLEGWRPVMEAIVALRRRFRSAMPQFFSTMQTIAQSLNGGPLVYGVLGGRGFEGSAFFLFDHAPEEFQSALEDLDTAIAVGEGREQSDLGVRTIKIGVARDRLTNVATAARAVRHFFKPSELSSLSNAVDCVNRATLRKNGGEYRYAAERLAGAVVDTKTSVRIGLPDDWPMINTEPLRRLCDLKS